MRYPLSQLESCSQELLAIEKELRDEALIYRPEVQRLLKTANATYSQRIYDSATELLRLILDSYNKNAIRQVDKFRPYCPASLCNDGDILICTQPDGTNFNIDVNSLSCGALVLGPQGGGKSRLLSSLIQQIHEKHPDVIISVIDFKNGFSNLPSRIDAKHIDLSRISLTLEPPSNIALESFVFELIPILAESTGLVYGVDLLNTAAERALKKVKNTSFCLRDILEELNHISTKSFRIGGYLDASKTALGFLIGKQNLFSCRKGVSINDLFSQNAVINARGLTHDTQAKFLVTYILYWLYQSTKNKPDSRLNHVLIVDDANRAIARPAIGNSISSLGNILSVIRSSGKALVAASQLPSQIDPAVVSLSRNMFVVGNINGSANLKVIKDFMGLTFDEANAITQFKQREMLSFVSNSSWSKPVHGFVPFVEDLPEIPAAYEDYSDVIEEWQPLSQLSAEKPAKATPTPTKLNSDMDKLIWDCINYPFDKVRGRVKRMGFSVRAYDSAMNTALQDGYLLRSMTGKSVYLIATKKTYEKFDIPCPYERSTSIEHAFYTLFTTHLLKQNRNIQKIQTEVPIGEKGATIDVTYTDNEGKMTAIEVTLNTSNLLSNAAKLQDTAYRVIWLCKDSATKNAVKAYFNKTTSLPKELINKFEYSHFSNFMKGGHE